MTAKCNLSFAIRIDNIDFNGKLYGSFDIILNGILVFHIHFSYFFDDSEVFARDYLDIWFTDFSVT